MSDKILDVNGKELVEGQWYCQETNGIIDHYAKFFKIINKNSFTCSERIHDNDYVDCSKWNNGKGAYCYIYESSVLRPIPISEISQYLPDNHPDKKSDKQTPRTPFDSDGNPLCIGLWYFKVKDECTEYFHLEDFKPITENPDKFSVYYAVSVVEDQESIKYTKRGKMIINNREWKQIDSAFLLTYFVSLYDFILNSNTPSKIITKSKIVSWQVQYDPSQKVEPVNIDDQDQINYSAKVYEVLLKKAKQRYPNGTKFKSMLTHEYFVSNENFEIVGSLESGNKGISASIPGKPYVYKDGKWAEIIGEDKATNESFWDPQIGDWVYVSNMTYAIEGGVYKINRIEKDRLLDAFLYVVCIAENQFFSLLKDNFRKATQKEIGNALIKEAENRYPKGVNFKAITTGNYYTSNGQFIVEYSSKDPNLLIVSDNKDLGRPYVYLNGEWAEIIPEDNNANESSWDPQIGDWCYILDEKNSKLSKGSVYKINQIDDIYPDTYHFDIDGNNEKDNSCWLASKDFRKATQEEIDKALRDLKSDLSISSKPENLKVSDNSPSFMKVTMVNYKERLEELKENSFPTVNYKGINYKGGLTNLKEDLILGTKDVHELCSTGNRFSFEDKKRQSLLPLIEVKKRFNF